MKITKLGHSCLLVEMPDPVNRTALFDPGVMSEVDVDSLEYLDDIFITHIHADHLDTGLIKQLVEKFPAAHITTTPEAVQQLLDEGIDATSTPPEGVRFFESPHEEVEPLFPTPPEIGIHYLDTLSHPGDSHRFSETMPILALPVTAPWGATVTAAKLALELKPKYIVPIHDWHWRDEARTRMYDQLEKLFAEKGITFISAVNGEPFVLDL